MEKHFWHFWEGKGGDKFDYSVKGWKAGVGKPIAKKVLLLLHLAAAEEVISSRFRESVGEFVIIGRNPFPSFHSY